MDRFGEFTDYELMIFSSIHYTFNEKDESYVLYSEVMREVEKRHAIEMERLGEEERENVIICECCDQITGYKIQPQKPFGLQ